jgi:heat shock protein HspQ
MEARRRPVPRIPSVAMICVNTNFLVDPLTDHLPKFVPGEVVEHVRDGYRGVVVAVDGHCKADPAWYMASSPQADRDQPWYYVLVDGTAECLYPAEEDLRPDASGRPIRHPLLRTYFERFAGGRYLRNDVEWPGCED